VADVTIPVASDAAMEGQADVTELVFTPGNWNIDQTVTVSGQDDAINDDDQGYQIVLSPAASADGNFAGVNPADVSVTNLDDDTPTARDDAYSINEEGFLAVDAANGVLANDGESGGLTLSAALVDDASNGSVSLNPNGSFSYVPDADFSGSDSFTYSVSDGSDSDTATVTITVNPVNDAPVASDDAYGVVEDGSLTIPAPGVLVNDDDVDGDPLSATLVTGVDNGTLTLNADGSFTYTPDADFFGTDSFSYVANDGTLNSATATVTITVTQQLIEELTVTPLSVNFGSAVVGTTGSTRTVQVENTGEVDVSIDATSLTANDASSFAIVADACSGSTLTAGDSCSVGLEFQPQSVGVLNDARLQIDSSLADSPSFADLVGEGLADEADLAIVIQPLQNFGALNQPFAYDILVVNFGPSDAQGATVASALDERIVDVTWSCVASAGASCPATGSGDLDEVVDIPAGGDVMFTVTGTLIEGPTEQATSAATVTGPDTPPDPVEANNADEVTVRTGVYADGFEPAPSGR
jgi:VCBS repeat-containing protein